MPGGARGPGLAVPGPAAPSWAGRGDLSELRAAAPGTQSKCGRRRYLGEPGPFLPGSHPGVPRLPNHWPRGLQDLQRTLARDSGFRTHPNAAVWPTIAHREGEIHRETGESARGPSRECCRCRASGRGRGRERGPTRASVSLPRVSLRATCQGGVGSSRWRPGHPGRKKARLLGGIAVPGPSSYLVLVVNVGRAPLVTPKET